MAGISQTDIAGGLQHDESLNVNDRGVESASTTVFNDLASNRFEGFGPRDFAGMAPERVPEFTAALNSYQEKAQEQANNFNPEAPREGAFKGNKLVEGLGNYFLAVKELLNKYVQVLNVENKVIAEAAQNYQQVQESAGAAVSSDADTVRGAAGSVNVD